MIDFFREQAPGVLGWQRQDTEFQKMRNCPGSPAQYRLSFSQYLSE